MTSSTFAVAGLSRALAKYARRLREDLSTLDDAEFVDRWAS